MINRTNIEDAELIERNPFGENLINAEIDGFVDDENQNRMMGYTDLVAYWPESGMAAHVNNADPRWYEAESLDDAMSNTQ